MTDAGASNTPPRWGEVFGGSLGRLTIGLFLLEVLGAVQILVVTTVMPAVLHDLGSIRLYGWAFSAAGLATVMTIPLAGRAVDRAGPIRPLGLMLGVFAVGTVVAAAAPTMPVFIVGRFLQGAGAGAQFAVSIGTVAKAYPDSHRARVLALLAAAWVVPGLVGPSFGALVATTVGWRWAFIAPLPLLGVAAALVFPGLARLPTSNGERSPTGIRWPIQLALGAAALLGGLSGTSLRTLPLALAGLALAIPALRHLVASDSARPGLPWALAAGFLLGFAFFATDGFVPLMLTSVRGVSLAAASVVITLATLGWSTGSWWQSRVASKRSESGLVAGGAFVIAIGTIGVASGLALSVPLVVPYVSWAIAGLGMGVAYPTVYLATMGRAGEGAEASTVALLLLIDSLGTAAGTGLGGSAVSLANAAGASLSAGLVGTFALALVAAFVLLGVAPRLSRAPS